MTVKGGLGLPRQIRDVEHLDDMLSEPTAAVVDLMARLEGDILVLGAAGKMGPSLARMAKRASDEAGLERRIVAVSRFSAPGSEKAFLDHGIAATQCDLLDPAAVAALPDAPNVVYMAGMKFGSSGKEALTWAMNTQVPGVVARRFTGSRIVAFSTGNVYPFSPIALGGSVEADAPSPVGEYAMSCLGRERVFAHYSETAGTPISLLRLNYAAELRYGVLADLAEQVWTEIPVDVSTTAFNAIWQGDANAMSLLALEHASSPPFVVNVAGPEQLSVRRTVEQLGVLLGRTVNTRGTERDTALLSNGQMGHSLYGYPRVPAARMVEWVADWTARGGPSLGKRTGFEVRDGRF